MLAHKPAHLSWAEAAGIPEVWLTAFKALFVVGKFMDGESILIHAGASGVGIAAIQMARMHGAYVTSTMTILGAVRMPNVSSFYI